MEKTPVKHGGRYKLKYRGTECLNCGHPLEFSDRYCPNCSQANSTKHLTMKDFFDEFFADLVNFDTRLVRTLYTMLWRPGRISKDFISGKRLTYVNPFRLLLSLAIIYFLLLSIDQDFDRFDRYGGTATDQLNRMPDFDLELDSDKEEAVRALQNLDPADRRELEKLGIKGLDSNALAKVDSLGIPGLDSLNLKQDLKERKRKRDSAIMKNPQAYLDSLPKGSFLNRVLKKSSVFLTLIEKDSVYTYEEAIEKRGLRRSWEDKVAFSVADSMDHLTRQPGTFIKEFISTVPFAIFLFLPLFTVFLTLVYIRKKYTYTDNLVFSFYSQALLFILLIASFLIDLVFGTTSVGWFFLIFAVYLFLAMRRFYGQGWFKTTIKYVFLNTVFIVLASLAAALFLAGSALTY